MKSLTHIVFLFIIALGLTACNHEGNEKTLAPASKSVKEVSKKPLDNSVRKELVEELVHQMSQDGMKDVKKVLPNLAFVKDIPKDHPLNISDGMSEESWMYSQTYNLTVVVCKMMNTPAWVFEGKEMSQGEFEKASKMMKEMMEMMDHGDMDMDDHQTMNDNAKPSFVAYSTEAVSAVHGKEKYAVSVLADWCGTCQRYKKDLQSKLPNLPGKVKVFEANFDKDKDFNAQYGITKQDTHLLFNADGSLAEKKSGASVDQIAAFFN